jgi:hypothetical protein
MADKKEAEKVERPILPTLGVILSFFDSKK